MMESDHADDHPTEEARMDSDRFDSLTRNLTTAGSRRVALGSLLAGSLALLGLGGTDAKKGKGKKKKKKKPVSVCLNGQATTVPKATALTLLALGATFGACPPPTAPPPPPPPPDPNDCIAVACDAPAASCGPPALGCQCITSGPAGPGFCAQDPGGPYIPCDPGTCAAGRQCKGTCLGPGCLIPCV